MKKKKKDKSVNIKRNCKEPHHSRWYSFPAVSATDLMKPGRVVTSSLSQRPLWLAGLLLPDGTQEGLAFPAWSKVAFYCFHSKFPWQLAPSLRWSDTSCCAKASPVPCHRCTHPSILSVWGSVWTTILLHPQIILLLRLIHDGSTYILAGKRGRWGVCGMKLPAVPSMSCHWTSSLICVTVSFSVVGPHLPRASLVWTLCQLHVGTDGSGGQMCRYCTSCSHYVLVSLT